MAFDPQALIGDRTQPSEFYLAVTPGGTALANGACRAILCDEDGALNLTDLSGAVRANVPVQKGYNPLVASVINTPSAGSAPGVVYAIY